MIMGRYFSTPTSRAGYKIRQFLNQIGIPVRLTNSSGKTNRLILVPFMRENNIPYKVMNYRYKGINTADLQNSYDILESKETWDKFREWCKKNKHQILESYEKQLNNNAVSQ